VLLSLLKVMLSPAVMVADQHAPEGRDPECALDVGERVDAEVADASAGLEVELGERGAERADAVRELRVGDGAVALDDGLRTRVQRRGVVQRPAEIAAFMRVPMGGLGAHWISS